MVKECWDSFIKLSRILQNGNTMTKTQVRILKTYVWTDKTTKFNMEIKNDKHSEMSLKT